MAGYSRIYCLGGQGGFQGADGINPIRCQIWVGEGNRQWWESHYFDDSIAPLGNITVVVPEAPNHVNALIDSCIAFLPDIFSECPSMAEVRREASALTRLDFDADAKDVPSRWDRLRFEARATFADLAVFEATLARVDIRPTSL
jgi:hypothetical protein